jgi:predicted site-specific integrase-resolvase
MATKHDTQNFGNYLTIKVAAAFLGVSVCTLRNWDRAGKVKAIRHPVNAYRLDLKQNLMLLLDQVGASK